MKAIGLVIIILCLITAVNQQFINSAPNSNFLPINKKHELNADLLFNQVNEWRIKRGMNAYTTDELTCNAANIRLNEIKKDFSHSNFKAKRFCQGCTMSENIARYYSTESDVLNGWIDSPSHLDNLLKPYQKSCIATSGNYAVQIFTY